MFDLLDRLDRMGPSGAPISVAIGLLLALLSAYLVGTAQFGEDVGRWGALGMRSVALFTTVMSVLFLLMGLRHRAGPRYPDPSDVFPSLPAPDFREAMYAAPRPLCACSDCRIHVPAQFSTGSCPACSSSLNWHEVESDDDADLVCSAVRADG